MNRETCLPPNLEKYKSYFTVLAKGEPKWIIAIYVRLSKEDGRAVSKSIENQIQANADALEEMDNFIVYDIYIDDGLTGTDFNRNDYQRLQGDIQDKIVNCFMVKDLSRYSRNVAQALTGLEEFVFKTKVRFVTVEYPVIDTFKDPKAISSAEVLDYLKTCEDHARVTSVKIRSRQKSKMKRGEPLGGFAPYGYLNNPDKEQKHYIQDPVASKVIRQIFLWSAEGYSNGEIARKLNEENIPNPAAYKVSVLGLKYNGRHTKDNSGLWWPATVGRVLKDKTHIGAMVLGKTTSFDHLRHDTIYNDEEDYKISENHHEKNVSEELFEKINETRKQRTRKCQKTGKVHLFANLVCCSSCGLSMKMNNNKGYQYLVCRTYRDLGKERCTKRTIRYDVLEQTVLNVIQTQIELVANLQSIIEKINKQPVICNQSIRLNQMFDNCQQEIIKTEKLFDGCYVDFKMGIISEEQFSRIRKETEKKLGQLRSTIQKISLEKRKIEQGISSNNKYFEMFLKYRNIETLSREILLELVHKIYINEDKSIKIEFNFEDQYLLILDYIEQNKSDKDMKKLEKKLK